MENEKENSASAQVQDFIERERGRGAELSRVLSQFKTLLFPQEKFGFFDKIANITLWNHKIANSQ